MTKTNLINKINELSPEMRIFLEQRLKTHLIDIYIYYLFIYF